MISDSTPPPYRGGNGSGKAFNAAWPGGAWRGLAVQYKPQQGKVFSSGRGAAVAHRLWEPVDAGSNPAALTRF